MNIELVPAGLVHDDLLAGMHNICFAEPWSAVSMADVLAMPGAHGLIAVDGGSMVPSAGHPGPAGFVLWRATAGEAEILTIAVLPPWRRRGLGAVLLEAALDSARISGAETMFLEVAADNSGAQALYSSRGFVRAGLRKGYYAGKDALVLAKTLVTTSS
jgi:ribosomal-protein-alanine N-acetyltransferase